MRIELELAIRNCVFFLIYTLSRCETVTEYRARCFARFNRQFVAPTEWAAVLAVRKNDAVSASLAMSRKAERQSLL